MSFLPDDPATGELPLAEPDSETDPHFLAKTYGYLFVALAALSVLGFISYRYLPRSWLAEVSAADSAIWLGCLWYDLRRPLGVVFPLFTLITGMELGELAHLSPQVFLAASGFTLLVFGGLPVFVLITGLNFSSLAGFVCSAWIVLAGAVFLSLHYHQHSALFGLTGCCVAGLCRLDFV